MAWYRVSLYFSHAFVQTVTVTNHEGRKDDADETVIRNRIKVYYDETAILKGYYQKQDKYFGVDGVGEINEITTRLSSVIDKL